MKIVTPSSYRQEKLATMLQEDPASTGPCPSYPQKREFRAWHPGAVWGCNSRSPSGSLRCSRSLLLETTYLSIEVASIPGRL